MILVDTDALIGLANPNDALHNRVVQLYAQVDITRFAILPETLGEFATLMAIRLGRVTAQQLVGTVANSNRSATRSATLG